MVPVFRKLHAYLGSQEEVPRMVGAGGVHGRKGLPRSGELRETSQRAPRLDLILIFRWKHYIWDHLRGHW